MYRPNLHELLTTNSHYIVAVDKQQEIGGKVEEDAGAEPKHKSLLQINDLQVSEDQKEIA